jgi:hypothetical protein
VGRADLRPDAVMNPDVDVAALTAPAAGLFLEGVYYKGDRGPGPVKAVMTIE